MANNTSPNRRLAGVAGLLILLTALTSLNGCGGGSEKKNTNESPLPPPGQQAAKGAKIARLNQSVFIRARGASDKTTVDMGERDLQNGDTITTDETGEAALSFGECVKIYLYQRSGLTKGSCPNFDSQLGNTYCSIAGTTAFKDCATNIVMQSESAVVRLIGTWASHTYLPDRQLSIILVFEGSASAQAVTDVRENRRAGSDNVASLHFWFSVPDDRLKELDALRRVGLNARASYPFKRLPELIAKAGLQDQHLEEVAKQAIKDGAADESILPFFEPAIDLAGGERAGGTGPGGGTGGGPGGGGPGGGGLGGGGTGSGGTGGGGTGGGSGGSGPGGGGPDGNGGGRPRFVWGGALPFSLTKVGQRNTLSISGVDGSPVVGRSVRLSDPDGTFQFDPPVDPDGPARLPAVRVAFAPKEAKSYNATLSFRDARGRPYSYKLQGEAASPTVELSSTRLNLTPQKSVDTISLRSTGRVPVSIGSVTFKNNVGNHFVLVKDTCSGQTISGQCEVTVRHDRSVANISLPRTDSAALVIDHDASAGKSVKVEGVVAPLLEMAELLTFGPVAVGGECEKTLRLTNNGDRPITFFRPAALNDDSEDFSIVKDDCTQGPLDKTCDIRVRFKPTAASARDGMLRLAYIGAGDAIPRKTELSGAGASPLLKIGESGKFDRVQIGAAASEKTFTLARAGNEPIRIERVSISGTGAADFALRQDACSGKLITDARCEVRVAFQPKAEGARAAELVVAGPGGGVIGRAALTPQTGGVATNSQASTQVANAPAANSNAPCAEIYRLTLGGSGYARWRTDPERDICFGEKSVPDGEDKKPVIRTLAIHSESTRRLAPKVNFEGGASSDFKVISNDCAGAEKSCTIKLQFTPTGKKERRAFLVLSPDDDTPEARIELFGRGQSGNPFKRFGRWVVGIFTDRSKRACVR